MAISEESRHHLYVRLEKVLGAEEATTLMEHLPPVGWADVATKRDLDAFAISIKRDVATREDVADLRVHVERELRVLSWRFISVFVAAVSVAVAVIKL
jgi:hypothetical protein